MGTFIKRAKLAKVLDLPFSAVRIHKTYVGGTFGGKIDLYSHEYCAARLSMITGRPVRIVATREEIFSAYRHGQPLIMEVKTGVRNDGTIVCQQVRAINNAGAYRGSGVVVIFLAWGFTMLPYRIPNLAYEGLSVYTNYPLRAPQRGHGVSADPLRDRVAARLDRRGSGHRSGDDQAAQRAQAVGSAAQRRQRARSGPDRVHRAGGAQVGLSRQARAAAASPKQTIRRGIGMGVSSYFGGSLIYPNGSGVIVKMADDGSATVLTGAIDVGQGAETVISQIVAEELFLPIDDVKIISSDTDTTPQDIGAWISGMTYVTGNAARTGGGQRARKAAASWPRKNSAAAIDELEVERQDRASTRRTATSSMTLPRDHRAQRRDATRRHRDRRRVLAHHARRTHAPQPGDHQRPLERELCVQLPGRRGRGRHRNRRGARDQGAGRSTIAGSRSTRLWSRVRSTGRFRWRWGTRSWKRS